MGRQHEYTCIHHYTSVYIKASKIQNMNSVHKKQSSKTWENFWLADVTKVSWWAIYSSADETDMAQSPKKGPCQHLGKTPWPLPFESAALL